jgi:DNA-binding PadR family transcriptional regulator
VENGLSRTEELALTVLAEGPSTGGALFVATQAREARPFMGDSTFFEILRRLASARAPLVTVERRDDADLRTARIAITDTGREVLARRADQIRLNGIDLWRGGVHLTGSEHSPWRWDAHRETLVS